MKEIIAQISRKHGIACKNSTAVSGGDINNAYQINALQGDVFIKINDAARYPKMFDKEAEALLVLGQNTSLKVPAVIAVGELDGFQYLLLEWLGKGKPASSFWSDFATGLGGLHRCSSNFFGWENSNYIGSLVQRNEHASSWPEFYSAQRILPLAKHLYNQSLFTNTDLQNAEVLCKRFGEIFPDEPPALLHGDLWAGNFMVSANGQPVIFDPACYYGHREMDIAMTLLFGGFDSSFYAAYNEINPLENNWQKRLPVAQLYPLLVHAVLFGGSYVLRCKQILNEWA